MPVYTMPATAVIASYHNANMVQYNTPTHGQYTVVPSTAMNQYQNAARDPWEQFHSLRYTSNKAFLQRGDFIWVEPVQKTEFAAPVGARVVESDGARIRVIDDMGNEEWLGSERRIRVMHTSSIQGVEDMIQLGDLHEAGILRNLQIRYREKLIYTYTGTILVAVNPYQVLPIYTPEQLTLYRNRRIGELPPHIFSIADNAYAQMMQERRDQCVIVSGESGAGKTESTKLVLQFLAHTSGRHSWIEQQILEANPIMEAFGNAKTVRNDNSSRFGKYIDIHFKKDGSIEGARIEQYLLEKSRIVSQASEERNYHIFYCMLAGLNAAEKKELDLKAARDYYYLTQGRSITAEGRDDLADYSDIRAAMKVLLFTDYETWSIFKLLSSILHLGNVKFSSRSVNNIDAAEVSDEDNIRVAAKHLQVSIHQLEQALTSRVLNTKGEKVVGPLTAEQSLDVRDAFVKGMYGRAFVWIVDKINQAIARGNKKELAIGILDIFGFENFDHNSFEQLCINYANEHLQQFFVKHIFKMEQDEYELEAIEWQHIEFTDNQAALELIGGHPMNIIAIVDEESRFPKGNDASMLSKLHVHHSAHEYYLKPKSDLNRSFGISHFAGVVFYDSRNFLDKNRDTFSTDMLSLVSGSDFKYLKSLFKSDLEMEKDDTARRRKLTIGTQFKKSLEQLMLQLETCQPFFIRCIKPNEFKQPLTFDRELCCKQLRYSGMMETIRIRKSGYPIRHSFVQFVERYRPLVNGIGPVKGANCREAARIILESSLGLQADFQLGKDKVFLKDAHDLFLEQERDTAMTHRIVTIQKNVRRWVQQRRYQRMRLGAVTIQRYYRGYAQRKRYQAVQYGFARLQALIRSRAMAMQYRRLRELIVQFQARCRGAAKRREYRHQRLLGHKSMSANNGYRHESETSLDKTAESISPSHFDLKSPDEIVEEIFGPIFTDNDSGVSESVVMQATRFQDLDSPPHRPQIIKHEINFESSDAGESASITQPVKRQAVASLSIEPRKTVGSLSPEDLSSYQFGKFAATYFQRNATPYYYRKPLRYPLLYHENTGDQIDNTPVMTKLYNTLSKNFGRKELEQLKLVQNEDDPAPPQQQLAITNGKPANMRKKLVSMTLKKKSKLAHTGIIESMLGADDATADTTGMMENRPTTNLEKLHLIIGHGILRQDLRDEIYCQICKQLSQNPSKNSYARGWILLSLCVGCFAPSDKFVKYLSCFIQTHNPPQGYGTYCQQRLQRTIENGTRNQPPSYLELQATKHKKPLSLPITLMDGTTHTLHADSATTANELAEALADKVGLQDRFGFSLYIALFDKVSSLGSGRDHVLDAVSQCEQYAKEQGAQERSAPWRLFYRKEIFAPWHDAEDDDSATALIYQQIVRGVKYGEYRFDKEEDLALLAAQQYFIEHGTHMDIDTLKTQLHDYIPEYIFESDNGKIQTRKGLVSRAEEKWLQLVMHSHRKNFASDPSKEKLSIKQDIVRTAKFKWPLLFSRFYEAYKFAGPALPKNEVIIAVNWTGIYVVDDQEQVLLELCFPEIAAIACAKSESNSTVVADTFTLTTIRGDQFSFQSPNAVDVDQLVNYFIDGLKRRSRFAVALHDQIEVPEDSPLVPYRKGDLIRLQEDLPNSSEWLSGENVRTAQRGELPQDSVYVLPSISKPPPGVIQQFIDCPDVRSSIAGTGKELVPVAAGVKPHTLEDFANHYFRPPTKRTINTSSRRRYELWRHSKEPLKLPLLAKLQGKEQPSQAALSASLAILKYMGDHPTRRPRAVNELTDVIFLGALKFEALRDEIYCQIIRQLTQNPNSGANALIASCPALMFTVNRCLLSGVVDHPRIGRLSEERGWELLWMSTGLFSPSQLLLSDVQAFLRTRRHPIAADCHNRLLKIMRCGQRRFPPHEVEVEAIQHKTTQIFHKIYFPDDTDEAIEVDSATRARDLCEKIGSRLSLKSCDGFALFVKISDKVISVPEVDFFFDFVRQLTDWIQRSRPNKDGSLVHFSYQVFFMRKLWLNAAPGKDVNADLIFHYHQELPKYLRGYHRVSVDDAVQLASLLFRAQFGDASHHLQYLEELLSELVPRDLTIALAPHEWKRAITNAYNNHPSALQANDAKIVFLRAVAKWPTFGSAFFEVKQSSDTSLPEKLLIAINKNGVSLVDPDTKDIIATYPFTRISNWSSGNNYFHMTIGNLMKGNRLLCETSLGYKMDDLLTSYIAQLLSELNKAN